VTARRLVEGTSFDCVSLAYINRATDIVSGRHYIPFIEADSLLTLTRPSETYDYVHHNEKGAELIGALFAERLSKSVEPTYVFGREVNVPSISAIETVHASWTHVSDKQTVIRWLTAHASWKLFYCALITSNRTQTTFLLKSQYTGL
jgi:hypothetical protein